MRSKKLQLVLLMITAALVAGSAAVLAMDGALDGKKFDIKLTRADGHDEGPDQLIFTGGSFDSPACQKYGFTKTSYETKMVDGALHFEASATSKKEGTNHWSGVITGDHIEGTLNWTKKGKVTKYTFEGKLAS